MANALYTEYKNGILGLPTHTWVDWNADDIKCVLVDHADDTPAPTTDVDLVDITTGSSLVATSGNMASVTIGVVAGGVVDMANFAFTTVTGDQCESLNWYKDSGTAATSPLILYIDTATGLPVTPNGADINVTLDPAGLFGF